MHPSWAFGGDGSLSLVWNDSIKYAEDTGRTSLFSPCRRIIGVGAKTMGKHPIRRPSVAIVLISNERACSREVSEAPSR